MATNISEEEAKELTLELMRGLITWPVFHCYQPQPAPPLSIRRYTSRTESSSWNISKEPLPGLKSYQERQRAQQAKRKITPYIPAEQKMGYVATVQLSALCLHESKGKTIDANFDISLQGGVKHYPEADPLQIVKLIREHPEFGFLYLVRDLPLHSVDYSPYRFSVCTYDEIDKSNYSTISPNGVLEVYMGESEYTSLDNWELDYIRYRKLIQMPSFSKFRMWKAFTTWHKNIRRAKFAYCREQVRRKLMNRKIPASVLQYREQSMS